jgi:PAS domain S-box-containing protein
MEILMIEQKKTMALFFPILLLFGLYFTSLYNYLLFHSIAEIFSVVVAASIFMLAWNLRRFLDNSYLLFLGIAYLFIGVLDALHTLAYSGMGVFEGYKTNLPTQLWIVARYIESLSLFIAPLFFDKKLRVNFIIFIYAVVIALLLGSIFHWKIFPPCFVEGTGLTAFKKISEYIISFIFAGAIGLLFKKRKKFEPDIFRLLVISIIITIASELAFTFYIHVYGFSNLIGHYLKIISFILIYKALIVTGLTKPYNLVFRDLKQAHDTLEQRVEERTFELINANQHLSRKMEEQELTDKKLRQAEKRYRTVADFTYDWEYWADLDGRIKYMSPSCERISGYSVQDFIENPSLLRKIILSEDQEIWDQHKGDFLKDLTLREVQFRIQRKDGGIRWIEHACHPVVDHQNRLDSIRASNRDITVRKLSEDALILSQKKAEMLNTKLLSAQETERARLARELHDDISQRLAYLKIEVDKVMMKNKSLPISVRGTLMQIGRGIRELSSDIHIISRRLHPITLEVLGIVNSIETECKNFTRMKKIPVTFDLDDTLNRLSKEISLCTYRILQEGLRNIGRHARATKVHVMLSQKNDSLFLMIKDNGIGFDPGSNMKKAGLGIASMTERARSIRGNLSIESQPLMGTAITLAAPINHGEKL